MCREKSFEWKTKFDLYDYVFSMYILILGSVNILEQHALFLEQ